MLGGEELAGQARAIPMEPVNPQTQARSAASCSSLGTRFAAAWPNTIS
jgi:hypothetical protein